MDVINNIIRKSSLNGMPLWIKATALFVFSAIMILLITMLVVLFVNGPEANFRYGY